MNNKYLLSLIFLVVFSTSIFSQQYPDQQIILRGVDLINNIEESSNVSVNDSNIELAEGQTEGSVTFKAQTSNEPFNRGLPSWNGFAQEEKLSLNSSFKIQMRFKTSDGWQRWITVGYWDKEIWSNYGYTSFSGGEVSVDYVKVYSYIKDFQFKVLFLRKNANLPAPSIKQLSFVVSDTRTTANLDINKIYKDNPPAIFYDTKFIYQYGVDDAIGGSICSPSSTAMILRSFGIDVDPYDFAVKTKDQYWGMFGVWPRNVQHAHMHGVRGSVTRYRTWSEAYEVLKNGGRIAMSLGKPLYKGHLIMLAGFDENGIPILHDPGSRNGYKRQHDKLNLSKSWFDKGGISYTFYLENDNLANDKFKYNINNVKIYPNPATDLITVEVSNKTSLKIINSIGQTVITKNITNSSRINVSNLKSGLYFIHIQDENGNNSTNKLIIK